MANEAKLIQDVSKAVDGLSTSFQSLQKILETNLAQQKNQITYINELKKALSGPEFKNFVSVSNKMSQAQTELAKQQKIAADIAKQEEQIRLQAVKTQQAAIKAAEAEAIAKQKVRQATANAEKAELSLKTAKDKVNKASQEAQSAYKRESDRLRELTQKARDAAVTYGINSKEAKKLTREQQELDKKLKRVNESLGIHNSNVGNYKSAISGAVGILGKFGVTLGGAQIALKAFNGVVKNSQTAGDAWARTVGELKGAFQGLFQAVGTGENLTGIIQAMKDGAEAGRQYASAIDDLFEGAKGAELQIATIEKQIAQAQVDRDIARAKYDRQAALDQTDIIEALENKKLEVITIEANKRLSAEREYFEKRTKLTQEDFENFLKNYRKEEDLRNDAIKFIEDVKSAEKDLAIARDRINTQYSGMDAAQFNEFKERNIKQNEERISRLKETTATEIQVYAELFNKWGGTTDEMIERYVSALVAIENAQRDSIAAQRRNEVARATEERLFAKETEKEKVDNAIETFEKVSEVANETAKVWKNESDIEKEISDNLTKHKIENLDKIYEKNNEIIESQRKAAEEEAELNAEISDAKKELFSEAANSYFEIENEKYEKALEANRAYYDNILANQQLDEEQRSLIEAEREKKENEIEAKKRANEKRQFVFNKLQALAEIAISLAKANAAALVYGPLLAPGIILKNKISAALQAGIVMAQALPMLDKGSDFTPSDYMAGEKRPEIRIKNGKASIIDQPTVFTNDPGAKIIGGADTARIMDSINNYTSQNILSEGRTITRDDKLVASLITKLLHEQQSGNNIMKKALSARQQSGTSEINRMRTQHLKNKLKN